MTQLHRYLPHLYRLTIFLLLGLPFSLVHVATLYGLTLLGWLSGACALGTWLWLAREIGDLALREQQLADREIGNRDRLRFYRFRVDALERAADEKAQEQDRLEAVLRRVHAIADERSRGRTVLSDRMLDQLVAEIKPTRTGLFKIVSNS